MLWKKTVNHCLSNRTGLLQNFICDFIIKVFRWQAKYFAYPFIQLNILSMTFCSFVVIFSGYLLFISKFVSRCHIEVVTKQDIRCKQFTTGFVYIIGIRFTLIFAELSESPVSYALFSVRVLYKFCMFCRSSGETNKSCSTKQIFADTQNGKAYQSPFQWNFRNHVSHSYLIHFSTIIFVLPPYFFSSCQLKKYINAYVLSIYLLSLLFCLRNFSSSLVGALTSLGYSAYIFSIFNTPDKSQIFLTSFQSSTAFFFSCSA